MLLLNTLNSTGQCCSPLEFLCTFSFVSMEASRRLPVTGLAYVRKLRHGLKVSEAVFEHSKRMRGLSSYLVLFYVRDNVRKVKDVSVFVGVRCLIRLQRERAVVEGKPPEVLGVRIRHTIAPLGSTPFSGPLGGCQVPEEDLSIEYQLKVPRISRLHTACLFGAASCPS